jgi:hypothetical protein
MDTINDGTGPKMHPITADNTQWDSKTTPNMALVNPQKHGTLIRQSKRIDLCITVMSPH